jgi:hypothetical protein
VIPHGSATTIPPAEVAMDRRKVVDEREARALLSKAERSGTELAVVARSRGVDGRSLNAWRINLERKRLSPRPVARRARRTGSAHLVELVPTVVAEPAPTSGARYTLRLGDVELDFDDEVRGDTLRRVLEAMRSC